MTSSEENHTSTVAAPKAVRPATDKPIRSVAWQLLRILLLGTLIGVGLFAAYLGIALLGV